MSSAYDDLVLQLEQVEGKHQAIMALRAGGEAAKPALLRGMAHPSYRVRHGCLLVLDHTIIDDPTRLEVLKALDDPHRKVRRAALHVLGCEVCKPPGYCGIEGVDLEAVCLNLAQSDPSGRVRRSALGRFMWRSTLDPDVVEAMEVVLSRERNDEVRKRAAMVLAHPATAAVPNHRDRHARLTETVEHILEGSVS